MASAKQELKKAIIKLSAEKDIDKISVDEIIKEAGVSRTIFYKLFQDKYDLAYYVFEDDVGSLVYNRYMDHGNHYVIGYDVFVMLGENLQYYKKLFKATGGYKSFLDWLTEYYVRTQGESIGKLKVSPEIHMIQYVYCSGICMLTMKWVLGELPSEYTIEFLAQCIDQACPPELRKLLQ